MKTDFGLEYQSLVVVKNMWYPTKYIIIFFFLFAFPISGQILMGTAPLAPGNYWKYSCFSWGQIDSSSSLVLNSKVTIKGQEYFVIKTDDFTKINYLQL
jgi:hypothetical protein